VRPFQIAPYGAIGSAGILADINLDPENQPPLFTPCLPVGSRRYMAVALARCVSDLTTTRGRKKTAGVACRSALPPISV